MTETTYREAIRQALLDAMQADPDVILIGEEVGPLWRRLWRDQGPDRPFRAPTG